MAQTIRKPDLLDTLTRRKRSVANFLETKGVSKSVELRGLLLELEKEYLLTDEFYRLCYEAVLLTPLPYPDIHIALSPEEIDKILDDPLTQNDPVFEKDSPKKTNKRRTKKD